MNRRKYKSNNTNYMPHLYMILLGCKPPGRNTEQHDIFFGIGNDLSDLLDDIYNFWPEANRKMHIDGWRKVEGVGQLRVEIVDRNSSKETTAIEDSKLFFLNLGGYKPGEFEEFHYKMLVAARDKGEAVQRARDTAFYQHTGFKGADSHIDDKYGVDVDDVFEIEDVLPLATKAKYRVHLKRASHEIIDPLQLGYLKLSKLEVARQP